MEIQGILTGMGVVTHHTQALQIWTLSDPNLAGVVMEGVMVGSGMALAIEMTTKVRMAQ